MSRTFRRKSIPQKKMWVYPENRDWQSVYPHVETYAEYLKKARAVYRADHNRMMFGFRACVPWYFRNLWQERPQRRRIKQQMFHALKNDTWDGLSIVPEKRDTWIYY